MSNKYLNDLKYKAIYYVKENIYFREKYSDMDGLILYTGGRKEWYKCGLFHREDGPAIEAPYKKNTNCDWFIDGKPIASLLFLLLCYVSDKEDENA